MMDSIKTDVSIMNTLTVTLPLASLTCYNFISSKLMAVEKLHTDKDNSMLQCQPASQQTSP